MQVDCPKRESGDERRVMIARAARAIIVEKGLEGLRTRDIAARVGINVATLHYHVPTKEALVALVAESLKEEFREQGLRRPRDNKTGMELLRMELEDLAETMIEAPDRFLVMGELVDRSRRDPAIAAILDPMRGYWRSQLLEIFRQGRDDGTMRPDLDPAAASQLFLSVVTVWRTHRPDRGEMAQVFAEIERAFAPAHTPKG